MRLVTIAVLSLGLGASAAHAQINLSWSDCGVAGTEHRFFGCETNEGPPYLLYGSFMAPSFGDEIHFLGLNARLRLYSSESATPDWWKLGSGECRAGAVSMSVDFLSGPYTCTDLWLGRGAGGMVWETTSLGPNVSQIRLTAAIPIEEPYVLEQDVEYYAFRLAFRRDRTVGPGACSGCDPAHCIFLDEIQLFQDPKRANDPILNYPIHRMHTVWQNGFAVYGHGGRGCVDGAPTAARATTWGTVKALYR